MAGSGASEEICVKDNYLQAVLEKVSSDWHEEANTDDKWPSVRSGLVNAAEKVLGKVGFHQPDWFRESLSSLKPLLEARNAAYSRWLRSGRRWTTEDSERLGEMLGGIRPIREAKNAWFLRKAEEIEREKFGGKKVWNAIRDMQRGRRGLLPSRSVVIHDEDGVLCSSKDTQHQRRHSHFTKVFNITSQFDAEVMESVTQRQVSDNLADEPTPAEVEKALGKWKNGKAAETSDILPEMLKVGAKSEDFVCMLTDLLRAMWEERRVPHSV